LVPPILDISGITNYLDALEVNSQNEDIAFGVTATTSQLPAESRIARSLRTVRALAANPAGEAANIDAPPS